MKKPLAERFFHLAAELGFLRLTSACLLALRAAQFACSPKPAAKNAALQRFSLAYARTRLRILLSIYNTNEKTAR